MLPNDACFPTEACGRREFLKKSLAGTLLLGSAGFLARCNRARIAPSGELASLDAREFVTLQAFCETVLPVSESVKNQVASAPLRIDREISLWSSKNRGQIKSLLALLENGTRYFFFSWRTFSELPQAERERYLRDWEESRFEFRREAFQALRMMAFFFFYSQEATWKALGYDGPWVKRADA